MCVQEDDMINEIKAFPMMHCVWLKVYCWCCVVIQWLQNKIVVAYSMNERWFACFLSFDRFKPNEGVIIIGATNFPEALDKYVHLCVCRCSLCKHQNVILPHQQSTIHSVCFWVSATELFSHTLKVSFSHLLSVHQCPDPPGTFWHAGDCP